MKEQKGGDLQEQTVYFACGCGISSACCFVASRLNGICTARCADMHLSFHAGRRKQRSSDAR